jgi:hypothetical protein
VRGWIFRVFTSFQFFFGVLGFLWFRAEFASTQREFTWVQCEFTRAQCEFTGEVDSSLVIADINSGKLPLNTF